MTEHSASVFVFFFLGEYSSLILMSAFMTLFFLGGYHFPNLHDNIVDLFNFLLNSFHPVSIYQDFSVFLYHKYIILNTVSLFLDKLLGSYIFGFKVIIIVFIYI